MIFTERTIKMSNDTCEIDNPIVLYRGDYNVEIRFTIIECPYKYSAKNATNIIEEVDASYGQLVIRVPNDGSPIFSDVVETKRGSIVFTLSAEMIDESIEVGDYTFQIRLFDANRESRATIPPVENGISIREPIAFEDVTTTNEAGEATVGYALTTAATQEDAFDSQGNYNKTTWATGDRITAAKLDKIEAGIDGVNKKVASGGTGVNNIDDTTASATTTYSSNKIESIKENLSSQIRDIANELGRNENGTEIDMGTIATTIRGAIKELKNSQGGSGLDLSSLTISTETVSEGTKLIFTDGTTTKNITIPSATDAQVKTAIDALVADGTLSALTIENRSIDESKIKFNTIHKHLLDDELKAKLSNSEVVKLNREYNLEYTQGMINSDGTIDTSKIAFVTRFLDCVPNEVLDLSNPNQEKVAFYDKDKNFISIVNITTTTNSYVVPENSYYFRVQNEYNGGTPHLITVRANKFKNKTFKDLICSPLKCKPRIQFTGDSNTYGYGLSSTSLSWANLFISQLQTLTTFKYYPNSKWVISRGAMGYSIGYNFKQYSSMEIDTDAESITLNISTSYDSAWKWYVDGVTDSANDNQPNITLDGNLHTIKVEFTAGQAVFPYFEITKTIECVNNAVSGVGSHNVTIESGYDWLLIMIGTNNRDKNLLDFQYYDKYEYCGKATYIVPFPTWKVESGYTASLMQMATNLTKSFKDMGFDILNCLDVASAIFCDTTKYYQGDLIHFNKNGHVLICNIVSSKLGLPTYLPFGN